MSFAIEGISVKHRRLLASLAGCCAIATACSGTSSPSAGGSSPLATSTKGAPLPRGAMVIGPEFFGMHAGCIGIGSPKGCLKKDDRWPAIPFGSYRIWDTHDAWSQLEPQRGKFNFTDLDKRVDAALQHHESILLGLGGTPNWAASKRAHNYLGAGAASNPKSLDDWRSYIDTVVTRYKGRIAAYQVWDEANLVLFWRGTPAEMAILTKVAAQEIRRLDPRAIVVSPSVVSREATALQWTKAYLDTGVGSSFDVLALHVHPRYHEDPEDAFKRVGDAVSLLKSYGINKPAWDTELTLGLTTPSLPKSYELFTGKQAQSQIARSLFLSLMWDTPRVYWYTWDDRSFGGLFLKQANVDEPTAAGAVWATVYHWLVGSWFKGCSTAGGVYSCQLRYANATASVDWTTGPTVTQRAAAGTSCLVPLAASASKLSPGSTVQISSLPEMIVSHTTASFRGLVRAPC